MFVFCVQIIKFQFFYAKGVLILKYLELCAPDTKCVLHISIFISRNYSPCIRILLMSQRLYVVLKLWKTIQPIWTFYGLVNRISPQVLLFVRTRIEQRFSLPSKCNIPWN